MSKPEGNPLEALVEHVGRYPMPAFVFVREGLNAASESVHGPATAVHESLQHFLSLKNLDWDDLIAKYHSGELPDPIIEAIEAAGGCEKLNRHVSGGELCWAMRDVALRRWGLLSRVVLNSWNIYSTKDFGRIVFGFIDLNLMQRQPEDTMEDFEGVFSFEEAFDETFRGQLEEGIDN